MKEHHIGIIVKNIPDEVDVYSKLGYYGKTNIIYDEVQHNNILLLENELSGMRIELVEPVDIKSTVYTALNGYHHICYEAESKDEIRAIFKKKGSGVVFTKMIKAVALDNRLVCFAMLRNGTIIEFICN